MSNKEKLVSKKPDEILLVPASPSPDDQPDDWDRANPRSLINLLPAWLRREVEKLPSRYYELSEPELRDTYFQGGEADQTTHRVRIGFWDEYDRCQRFGDNIMSAHRIVEGICSPAYLKNVVHEHHKLAYIIIPPAAYELCLKDLHELGFRQARAALSLPIIGTDGKPNIKLIEAQTKITQHIDMRLKGAVVQRIDQRNVNVTMKGTMGDLASQAASSREPDKTPLTLPEIEAKLLALRGESERLQVPGYLQVDMMKDTVRNSQQLAEAVIEADIIESDAAQNGKLDGAS